MTSVAFQGNAVAFAGRQSVSSGPQQPNISLDGASDSVSFAGGGNARNASNSNGVIGCIAGCCGIPILLGLLACVGLRFAFKGKGG